MTSLAKMTDEELEAENVRLMQAKAEAEAPIKAQQAALQAELTRRARRAPLVAALEGLSPDDRAALLAEVSEG